LVKPITKTYSRGSYRRWPEDHAVFTTGLHVAWGRQQARSRWWGLSQEASRCGGAGRGDTAEHQGGDEVPVDDIG
jgi:hypothetical protein